MACESAWNHLWSNVHKEMLASGHLVFNKAGFKFLRFTFLIYHCFFQFPNIKKNLKNLSFRINLPGNNQIYFYFYFYLIPAVSVCSDLQADDWFFVSSTGTVGKFYFK